MEHPEELPARWPLNLSGLSWDDWLLWKENGEGFYVVRFELLAVVP